MVACAVMLILSTGRTNTWRNIYDILMGVLGIGHFYALSRKCPIWDDVKLCERHPVY